MDLKIEYFCRHQYGQARFYAVDSLQKKAIKMITGNESITKEVAEGLKLFGFEVIKVDNQGEDRL